MKRITTLAALAILLAPYPAVGAPTTAVKAQPNGATSAAAPQQQQLPQAAVPSGSQGTSTAPAVGQMPAIIEHYGQSKVPARSLFRTLQSQFAGGWLGPYQVVSSDRKSQTLVIRRNAIDADNWSKWAYCKVGPLDMLDSLRDGAATVTIKLTPARKVTFTSAAADFEGTYGLTSASKNVTCMSRGVLEDNLLAAIAEQTPPPTRPLAKRERGRSNKHHPAHRVG
jgi:hypothetical protein